MLFRIFGSMITVAMDSVLNSLLSLLFTYACISIYYVVTTCNYWIKCVYIYTCIYIDVIYYSAYVMQNVYILHYFRVLNCVLYCL